MAGNKDRQAVVRMTSALWDAVEAHRRALEQAGRFGERVTQAQAIRDLIARGLAAVAKKKP